MTEQTRRASRLLEIERLLRRRPGGMSARELANELDYSQRTIQRDIAVLESELGVPLEEAPGRRYRIMAGSVPLAPVRFTLQEARAMLQAARLFLRHADERDPDGIMAIEKLAETLPEGIARQVEATARELRARPQDRHQTAVLRTLTEAWAAGRAVAITYQSANSPGVKATELDIFLLEPSVSGATTYAIGHSSAHNAVRQFKLDRIRSAETTPRAAAPGDVGAIQERLARSWSAILGDDDEVDIVLDFAPEVAERVRETYWHPSQQLTSLPDGGVRLELRLSSLLDFVPWVRSWGPAVRAVAPPELRERVATDAASTAALYSLSR